MLTVSSSNIKQLIICRGPSGSGKSRMAKEISKQYNAPIFSSDDFFMKNGVYEFDIKQIGNAHDWNRHRVEEAMKKDNPTIVIDNTNTQFWEMQPYVQLAQQYGYKVQFEEPNWNPNLKTPEGKWNTEFLTQQQLNTDRQGQKKSLDPSIVQRMVDRYEYDPTVEKILGSTRK